MNASNIIAFISLLITIPGVIAFFQNQSETRQKVRDKKELDAFYVWLVNDLHQGTHNVRTFEIGSKEFFLAEELVLRGQLKRSGFKGSYSLP